MPISIRQKLGLVILSIGMAACLSFKEIDIKFILIMFLGIFMFLEGKKLEVYRVKKRFEK
jgi:hypothetical protein